MKKIIAVTALTSLVFIACRTSKTPSEPPPPPPQVVKLDCSGKMLSYTTDIKPIIEASCTGCHGNNAAGGFNFKLFEDVKKACTKGEMLGTIKHSKGFPAMPPNASKLSQSDIDKIECWINNGMKE